MKQYIGKLGRQLGSLFGPISLPCGCSVNRLKGLVLLYLLKRKWFKLFDLAHRSPVV